MARIVPYEVSMMPEGDVQAQHATAQDFGGDGGFGALGEGIQYAGQQIDQVQQDQARIWASTAIAQAEVQTRQKWQQHLDSLDPTAPDYPEKISSLSDDANTLWEQTSSDLQAKAPGRVAGRMIAAQMGRAQVRFTGEAMEQQSALNAGYTTNLVVQGAKASSDLLAASPDNDTYTRLAEQTRESIANLKSIDPNTKLKLIDGTEHQLAVVQAQSFASQHPADFLKMVNAAGGVGTKAGGVKGMVPTTPGSVPAAAPAPAATPEAPTFLSHLPSETQDYVPSVLKRLGNAPAVGADGRATQALVKAVIGQESGGNPNAKSGAGAEGMMQVMPATAASMGLPNADLTDPAQNVSIGTAYLNMQLRKYRGDVHKALAAYNAGPGATDAAIAAVDRQAAAAATPQVQPLTDQEIAKATPPLAGWDKLTWGEKVQTVRQAEGLLGKHLADDRGATTSAIQDFEAAVNNGLTPAMNLNDPRFSVAHLTQLYGADKAQRVRTELEGLQETSQAIKGFATMPDSQAESTLATLRQNASGEGADALAPAAQRAATALARVQTERRKAPLEWAKTYGLGGYQELDWSDPSKLQTGLAQRVATARTMTTEYGAKPTLFDKADIQQAQTALTKLSPGDRVDYLAAMVRGIPDPSYGQLALKEVMPNGNTNLMYAANLALKTGGVQTDSGPVSNLDTARMIAEGDALLHPQAITGNEKATKADNLAAPAVPVGRGVLPLDTKAFDAAFSKAIGGPAAFAGPNADLSMRMGQETYNAVKAYYVAYAVHNRKDVSAPVAADVERAVEAVTGGVWQRGNGDALFAPQGMPMQQFQDQFAPRAINTLEAAGFDPEHAQWMLDHATVANAQDGKYVFMNGGRPVVSPVTGHTVILDYSTPYAAPAQAAPESQADALRRAMQFSAGRGA